MNTIVILLTGAAVAFTTAGLLNNDRRLNGLAALAAIAAAAFWAYDAMLPERDASPPAIVELQPEAPKPELKTEPLPSPSLPKPNPTTKKQIKKQIYDRVGESGEIAAE